MCLAVYKPAGVLPDWEAYREGFRCNSHGAGFAVVDSGNVLVHKGFFTFDEFREALLPVGDKQAAIHFRLATHGKTDRDNCHPFLVRPDLALIHNGILPIQCNLNAAMSDTWHYAELILRPLAERDPDFFVRPELVFLGSAAITGSKFVFLRGDGTHAIWNEDDGHWDDDAWWSNRSYQSWGYYRREAVRVRGFDPEPEVESEYREYLRGEVAWAYDDLLELGYSPQELDDYLRSEGDEALIAYAEDCLHAEEEGLWTK
jgi:hypothetical protein